MYLVETKVGHPTLRAWKYPLPGDPVVAMLQRVVIDVESGGITRFQMAPDFHRATLGDNFSLSDMQWSPDAQAAGLRFDVPRSQAGDRSASPTSPPGTVRTVFDETEKTHFESRTGWRVLWSTNEMLWYSQRDNWGHLYLYDLATGDAEEPGHDRRGARHENRPGRREAARTLWFVAMGREKGQDPYFQHLYRIGLDGKNYVSLTPDDGDHTAQVSPSGKYIVDTSSTPRRSARSTSCGTATGAS